ncbi:hypothetical protein LXA43DRAFT_730988 [Ganoderma leucocontextum]|nr:hypothetical protein LXA43DRAFT_730988 [Ganoderma leucocontextum]
MPTPYKRVKTDQLPGSPPYPPLNQLANVNARAKPVKSRSRAHAVVGTNRRPRAQQKTVKMLEEMPLDVLYEICSHLDPCNLLALTRTSKGLRTVLTQRNCAFIWRASRALVGLLDPVKSFGMSEPAFASILFSTHCHGCGKAGGNFKILWPVPVRYCPSCKEAKFGEATDRVQAIALVADFEVSDLVLFTRMNKKEVQLWHLPQLEKIEANLVTPQDADEKRRYVQGQVDYVAAWKEHVPALVAWLQDYREKMKVEVEVLQRKRCVAAMARLRAAGWNYEVDMMGWDDLHELSLLNPLTSRCQLNDQGWNRIQATVMEFVSGLRKPPKSSEEARFRLRWRMRLVERALRQYRRSKGAEGAEHEKACGLRFGDLVAVPAVRALLEDESRVLGTRDAFLTRLADMIPSLVVGWHEECKSAILSCARADLQMAGVPLADELLTVDLAIMSFRCDTCLFRAVLRWPEVLAHACLRDVDLDENPPPNDQVYETEAWRYLAELGWEHAKWNLTQRRGRRISCTLSLVKPIRPAMAVISACGLDPGMATAQEMDNNGARFVCRICSEGRLDRKVYDWTRAIQHDTRSVSRDRRHSEDSHWIRLPEDQAARARALEATVEWTSYTCTWCYYHTDISNIRQHVQLHHEQANPRSGEDYCCEETRIGRVIMYSEGLMQDPDAQEQVHAGKAFFVRF